MSLEAALLKVRAAVEGADALKALRGHLEKIVGAESAAKAAEKRRAEAQADLSDLGNAIASAKAGLLAAQQQAAEVMAEARQEATAIKKDARAKADKTLNDAKAKAEKLEQETAVAAEKFAVANESQKEVLAMLGAQIAHGEAKLAEVREAIAKIVKV